MIDIILYSASGPASFLLDMNEEESASNPSLEIVHGENTRVRHFMPRENLITLRDLLNNKLPSPAPLTMEQALQQARDARVAGLANERLI